MHLGNDLFSVNDTLTILVIKGSKTSRQSIIHEVGIGSDLHVFLADFRIRVETSSYVAMKMCRICNKLLKIECFQ